MAINYKLSPNGIPDLSGEETVVFDNYTFTATDYTFEIYDWSSPTQDTVTKHAYIHNIPSRRVYKVWEHTASDIKKYGLPFNLPEIVAKSEDLFPIYDSYQLVEFDGVEYAPVKTFSVGSSLTKTWGTSLFSASVAPYCELMIFGNPALLFRTDRDFHDLLFDKHLSADLWYDYNNHMADLPHPLDNGLPFCYVEPAINSGPASVIDMLFEIVDGFPIPFFNNSYLITTDTGTHTISLKTKQARDCLSVSSNVNHYRALTNSDGDDVKCTRWNYDVEVGYSMADLEYLEHFTRPMCIYRWARGELYDWEIADAVETVLNEESFDYGDYLRTVFGTTEFPNNYELHTLNYFKYPNYWLKGLIQAEVIAKPDHFAVLANYRGSEYPDLEGHFDAKRSHSSNCYGDTTIGFSLTTRDASFGSVNIGSMNTVVGLGSDYSHPSSFGPVAEVAIGNKVGIMAPQSTGIGSQISMFGHAGLALGQAVSVGDHCMGINNDMASTNSCKVSETDTGNFTYDNCHHVPALYSALGNASGAGNRAIACMPTVIGNGGVDTGSGSVNRYDSWNFNTYDAKYTSDNVKSGNYTRFAEAVEDNYPYCANDDHIEASDFRVIANGGLAVGSYGSLPYSSVLYRWGAAFGRGNYSSGVNAWCVGHTNSSRGHGSWSVGMNQRSDFYGQLTFGTNNFDYYEIEDMYPRPIESMSFVPTQEHRPDVDNYNEDAYVPSIDAYNSYCKSVFQPSSSGTASTHTWIGFISLNYTDTWDYMTTVSPPPGWKLRGRDILSIELKEQHLLLSGLYVFVRSLGDIPNPLPANKAVYIVTSDGTSAGEVNHVVFNPDFKLSNIPSANRWIGFKYPNTSTTMKSIGGSPFRILYKRSSASITAGTYCTGSESLPMYPVSFNSFVWDKASWSSGQKPKFQNKTTFGIDLRGNPCVEIKGGGLIVKDTVTGTPYKITVTNGAISVVQYTDFTS